MKNTKENKENIVDTNDENTEKMLKLIEDAQAIGMLKGMPNITQLGLMKELKIARVLGHQLYASKKNVDAVNVNDHNIKYEYCTFQEDKSGQWDRMFKSPPDKRIISLERITRNSSIFFAVFSKSNQFSLKRIYECVLCENSGKTLLEEINRQLDGCKNEIAHVGLNEKWIKDNCKLVHGEPIEIDSKKKRTRKKKAEEQFINDESEIERLTILIEEAQKKQVELARISQNLSKQ